MPMAIKSIINDVPPWLIKTNGTPVKGKTPVAEAIFINDWATISITIPETKSLLNKSGELLAIRSPRRRKSK